MSYARMTSLASLHFMFCTLELIIHWGCKAVLWEQSHPFKNGLNITAQKNISKKMVTLQFDYTEKLMCTLKCLYWVAFFLTIQVPRTSNVFV